MAYHGIMPTNHDDRPFIVLYRAPAPTKSEPDRIRKGRRTFRTREEMNRWIRDAPYDYAITYTN